MHEMTSNKIMADIESQLLLLLLLLLAAAAAAVAAALASVFCCLLMLLLLPLLLVPAVAVAVAELLAAVAASLLFACLDDDGDCALVPRFVFFPFLSAKSLTSTCVFHPVPSVQSTYQRGYEHWGVVVTSDSKTRAKTKAPISTTQRTTAKSSKASKMTSNMQAQLRESQHESTKRASTFVPLDEDKRVSSIFFQSDYHVMPDMAQDFGNFVVA
jgi:hypothetical protein